MLQMEPYNKVAVVDDHEFFRNGLITALKHLKFVEFAYEATNGKEFIEKQKKHPADIVLIDLKMPVLGGYEAILESKKLFPDLKIIVLTMFEEDEYIRKSIAAGVQGYLLKNVDHETLKVAIKYVLEGKQYYSNELMPFFTRQLHENDNSERKSINLTNREKEILQLIFEGLSNEEIANKLHISIRTVTNHRANLKEKTNSKNTACLISYGIRNKIFAV
jgi:DNA-binding NarL/FixJ family response regulator